MLDLERIITWVGKFLGKDTVPTGIVEAPLARAARAMPVASTRGQVMAGLAWSRGLVCVHDRTFLQVSFLQRGHMRGDNGRGLVAEELLKKDP